MTESYFEATRFWTVEKIKIPLSQILNVEDRSSVPGEEADHARVFINWVDTEWGGRTPHPLLDKEWMLLITLEDGKRLNWED